MVVFRFCTDLPEHFQAAEYLEPYFFLSLFLFLVANEHARRQQTTGEAEFKMAARLFESPNTSH